MSREIITSRQNPTVKLICSLLRKKEREETGLFRFDGIKLALEAKEKGIDVRYVIVNSDKLGEIEKRFSEAGLALPDCTVVPGELFEKMSDEKSPEGIITVAKALDKINKIATINNKSQNLTLPEAHERVMILESLRDPGNLGTAVRTAAALGIDRLVVSSDCADLYNPKTIRAAMGALFTMRIDVVEGDLSAYIGALRGVGRRVFGAALHTDALTLGEFCVNKTDVFVIGNEGHGLTDDTKNACDACVLIPMREGSESLNAAMAAGIFMWETSRAK